MGKWHVTNITIINLIGFYFKHKLARLSQCRKAIPSAVWCSSLSTLCCEGGFIHFCDLGSTSSYLRKKRKKIPQCMFVLKDIYVYVNMPIFPHKLLAACLMRVKYFELLWTGIYCWIRTCIDQRHIHRLLWTYLFPKPQESGPINQSAGHGFCTCYISIMTSHHWYKL